MNAQISPYFARWYRASTIAEFLRRVPAATWSAEDWSSRAPSSLVVCERENMFRHGWPIPGRAGLLVPGDGKALAARRIPVRENHLWRQQLLCSWTFTRLR
jgi:hypothetical protein